MSHTPLTPTLIRQIAELARLRLTEDELAALTPQLEAIVGYVDQLQQAPTAGVEPLAHALPVQNVFREADEPGVSLSVDEALACAPQTRTNGKGEKFYAVPAVLE